MALRKNRGDRKSLGQPAWITLDGGFGVRRCFVHDISDSGARISLDEAAKLTARLRLAVARDARTGHMCQVVWRRGTTVGLKFVR